MHVNAHGCTCMSMVIQVCVWEYVCVYVLYMRIIYFTRMQFNIIP